MLILQRRVGESIMIGDNIELTVTSIDGSRVRLAIKAPVDIPILRGELVKAKAANQDAAAVPVVADELLHLLEGALPEVSPAVQAAYPHIHLTIPQPKHSE